MGGRGLKQICISLINLGEGSKKITCDEEGGQTSQKFACIWIVRYSVAFGSETNENKLRIRPVKLLCRAVKLKLETRKMQQGL